MDIKMEKVVDDDDDDEGMVLVKFISFLLGSINLIFN